MSTSDDDKSRARIHQTRAAKTGLAQLPATPKQPQPRLGVSKARFFKHPVRKVANAKQELADREISQGKF